MKSVAKKFCFVLFLIALCLPGLYSSAAGTLTCVGLYSETDAGSIAYRVGNGAWIVIEVGDVIPANAEIRVNVDRDWIEVIPSNNPNAVYELAGSENGDVVKKVADILKGKPRTVSFPKKGKDTDPAFKDKMAVVQYLGRQKYKADATSSAKDIKYGDLLDIKGNVNMIAINSTLKIMYPNGEVATVVGPLKFDVAKMFTKENLYKYLNVAK